jgi:hypothetical protein
MAATAFLAADPDLVFRASKARFSSRKPVPNRPMDHSVFA